MRIFTFSGIRGSFVGTNDGAEIIQLARDLVAALPAHTGAVYSGAPGEDHFTSRINWTRLLGEVGLATLLDGSPLLNEEAARVAPVAAAALRAAPLAEGEPVVIVAHSQGTNNATFTLRHLLTHDPSFLNNRPVRCLFLDPKVGRNHVHEIFGLTGSLDLPFLFLQSENDLLSNQGVIGTRFIDQFDLGNHLLVAGLGHNDIEDWEVLASPKLRWLTRGDYRDFIREVQKERIRIQNRRGRPGWTTNDMLKLEQFKKRYPMDVGALTLAVKQFAQGRLAHRYES